MTMHDEAGFSTGEYTVIRSTGGVMVKGRWQRAEPGTLTIEADIQDAGGTDLKDLPEGVHSSEVRTVFTSSALFGPHPGDPEGLEADVLLIGEERWRVTKVSHFPVISGHYRATIQRLKTP